MLYIYVIQQCGSRSEVYSSYFAAATRCQSHIAAIAEKGSLSERYCLVLEELRVEALRQIQQVHQSELQISGLSGESPNSSLQTRYTSMQNAHGVPQGFSHLEQENILDLEGNMPGFTFPNDPGWEQFTNILSSGLGNIDGLLSYDAVGSQVI